MLLVAIPLFFIVLVIFYATKGLVPLPVASISVVLIVFFAVYIIRKQHSSYFLSDLKRMVTQEEMPEEECDQYV